MTDYNDIKARLVTLVENRNYFFRNTTKSQAEKYLQAKTDFTGMDEHEIQALENELGKTLPHDFKEYLKVFGKNCGELFCEGHDLIPRNLKEYRGWAQEIIDEYNSRHDHKIILAKDAIVFFFHQGYSFYYFDRQDQNDLVYLFVEGDFGAAVTLEHSGFNELLEAEVARLEKYNRNGKDSDGHFLTVRGSQEFWVYPSKDSGEIPREIGDRFIPEKESKPESKGIWASFLRLFQ